MTKSEEFNRELEKVTDGYWDVTFAAPFGKRSASLSVLRYVRYEDGDGYIAGRYYDPHTNGEHYTTLPGEIIAFRRVADEAAVADWQRINEVAS
jgi:hypothetical protein